MKSLEHYLQHFKFVIKKPRVIPRIIKNYYLLKILKKNRLRTIDWAITYHCNSCCKMCSAKLLMTNPKKKGKSYLSPDEMINTWNQAVKLGAIHVNLTGGEPTLRKDEELIKIIKGINKQGALISMVTNSIRMDYERLKKFKDAGLDTLQLSLESMNPKVHDDIRRSPGNWEKLMQVFKWAKKLNLIICLSAVITKDNFDEIKKIENFAKKEKVFLLLNPISASGEKIQDRSLNLTEDYKDKYYKFLYSNSLLRADTVFNFRGGRGCPAGVERIEISAYGDVMTCPHVQVHYGNVLEEPLNTIYKRISQFPYLKNFEKDCRHVFNKEYIKKIMDPIKDCKELPISIYDHPVANEPEIKDYLKNELYKR